MGDDSLALLLEKLDQPLLLGDQSVDLGGFAVEEASYCLLFAMRGIWDQKIANYFYG
jgi:hypothetical protein